METIEIEKQKMDSLKALAETNLEVSKIKEVLETLKKEQSVYIKEREEKALTQIRAMLDESRKITNQTYANYCEIQDLAENSSILAKFLVEAHAEFIGLVNIFEETTHEWEDEVAETQKELAEVRKQIKIDAIQVKNDQDAIENRKKEVKNAERKVKDQRETLERALNRLKK